MHNSTHLKAKEVYKWQIVLVQQKRCTQKCKGQSHACHLPCRYGRIRNSHALGSQVIRGVPSTTQSRGFCTYKGLKSYQSFQSKPYRIHKLHTAQWKTLLVKRKKNYTYGMRYSILHPLYSKAVCL